MQDQLKQIPAVGDTIHRPEIAALLDEHPRSLVVRAISEAADGLRQAILAGKQIEINEDEFSADVIRRCGDLARPKLRRVINATGIIVHTNLGRSVLSQPALGAVIEAATTYSNLEYDLDKGRRGSRHSLVADLLCEITGAQAAMAVNNNAAAVLLSLNTLAEGHEVVISRGELVEIGGSFRVPDVMAKSGARMVEVGTTNKTHLHDYHGAITDHTSLFLKVHASNYRIVGFTRSVAASELVELGHPLGIPVMEDLGSGFLGPSIETLRDEPTVQETVASGVDIVTFSGDKLLGGPQAGIILGRKDLVAKIAQNPLARAVRCDKMTLAALEATLRIYREPQKALSVIPTLRKATLSVKVLREKARRLSTALKERIGHLADIRVVTTRAQIGGGAMPLVDIPSAAVAIKPKSLSVQRLDRMLHRTQIPIIGRIEDDRFIVDMRTILDGETKITENALCDAIELGAK